MVGGINHIMGQGDIMMALEEHGPLTTAELESITGIGRSSLNTSLKKLLDQKVIKSAEVIENHVRKCVYFI